jgi:hypothetical protein
MNPAAILGLPQFPKVRAITYKKTEAALFSPFKR